MRFLTFVLTALAILQLTSGAAEARKRGSSAQEMDFVAPTKFKGPNDVELSLCHLTTVQGVFFINFWRSSEGYVLAENKCDSQQFFNFNEGQFETGKQQGLIDSAVADEPKMTMGMLASGFWGFALLAAVLIFALYSFVRQKSKSKARHASYGDISPYARNLLDVMCHAAAADGNAGAEEFAVIQKAASDVTGQNFTSTQIETITQSCDKRLSELQFKSFGKGMSDDEKMNLFRSAYAVIAADNDVSKAENKFMGQLAKGFRMNQEQIDSAMAAT